MTEQNQCIHLSGFKQGPNNLVMYMLLSKSSSLMEDLHYAKVGKKSFILSLYGYKNTLYLSFIKHFGNV